MSDLVLICGLLVILLSFEILDNLLFVAVVGHDVGIVLIEIDEIFITAFVHNLVKLIRVFTFAFVVGIGLLSVIDASGLEEGLGGLVLNCLFGGGLCAILLALLLLMWLREWAGNSVVLLIDLILIMNVLLEECLLLSRLVIGLLLIRVAEVLCGGVFLVRILALVASVSASMTIPAFSDGVSTGCPVTCEQVVQAGTKRSHVPDHAEESDSDYRIKVTHNVYDLNNADSHKTHRCYKTANLGCECECSSSSTKFPVYNPHSDASGAECLKATPVDGSICGSIAGDVTGTKDLAHFWNDRTKAEADAANSN